MGSPSLSDADVVQAFLVADEILRQRKPVVHAAPAVLADRRMPRHLIAFGTRGGGITVEELPNGGD